MAKKHKNKKLEINFHSFATYITIAVLCLVTLSTFGYLLSIIINPASHKPLTFQNYLSEFTLRPKASVEIPILMYHYVEVVKDRKDTIRQSLDILPTTFENQLISLKNSGYTFITPSYLVDVLDGKKKLPLKPIILSFDDGYGDFYTDVLPLLKKYHVRAIEYVISGVLDKPNYMTSDQLKEVISTKLVEIGCHTVDHPDMKHISIEKATEEIVGCEDQLKQNFGIRPVSFAYPYGSYKPELFPLLKAAGLKNAVTTKPGNVVLSNDIYEIPRIRPGARVGQELVSYLEHVNFISTVFESNKHSNTTE